MNADDNWLMDGTKDAVIEVFRELGSGHTEAVYEAALEVELGLKDINSIRRQVPCPISYKNHVIGTGFIDLLIDGSLIVEVKAIAKLSYKEQAQIRKYLYGTGLDAGLLINFGAYVEIVEVSSSREKENVDQTTGTPR